MIRACCRPRRSVQLPEIPEAVQQAPIAYVDFVRACPWNIPPDIALGCISPSVPLHTGTPWDGTSSGDEDASADDSPEEDGPVDGLAVAASVLNLGKVAESDHLQLLPMDSSPPQRETAKAGCEDKGVENPIKR